jgi:hypothetical protein
MQDKMQALDTSRIQSNLSHKYLNNSTYDSFERSRFLSIQTESQSIMISRRLKDHRHPLSGISKIMPEIHMGQVSESDMLLKETKNAQKLNSRILETWLNNTVSDAVGLDLPDKLVKNESKIPLVRFGIDRTTLLNSGLQSLEVDRIYRSLFVYSIGFFQLIKKILEHTKKKYTIITGIWKVYAILLEYCCQFDYEMIITTLNIEKKEEMDQVEKDFKEQIAKMEEHEKQILENMNVTKTHLKNLQKDLMEEIQKREHLEDELLQRGSGHEEEVTMRLQFESQLNQMYAKIRDMDTKALMLIENTEEMQGIVAERTKTLEKERKKNLELIQYRIITEQEMKIIAEKAKQTEVLNNNLEQRLVDCYAKIEELGLALSNVKTQNNENLNQISQKKIETNDLKFSIEIYKNHINKLTSLIEEQKIEKEIQMKRIISLEETLVQESNKNGHYQQEYAKVKEIFDVYESELAKYKAKSYDQEVIINKIVQEKDSLTIHNESLEALLLEYKDQLKQAQEKLEEINKARRLSDEKNENLKSRLEYSNKEVSDCRAQIMDLKETQENFRNNEIELQSIISGLNIKIMSTEKQFDIIKGTLSDKINNLNEILESEKNARVNWIHRYEEEQKAMTNITKELLDTQDKLNDLIIKNNNLNASLEENNLMLEKLSEKSSQDLEENLKITAYNEELTRKYRTSQILLERVDKDYRERVQETEIQLKKQKEINSEADNRMLMSIEDIWVQSRLSLEKYEKINEKYLKTSKILETIDETISNLKIELQETTEIKERRGLAIEDLRAFIGTQDENLASLKGSLKVCEGDLNKCKKDLQDFRNLVPPDLRNSSNPFKVLLRQISEFKTTLSSIETSKPETVEFEMQYQVPLPDLSNISVQTDYADYPRSSDKNNQRRHSSSSSLSESLGQDFQAKNSIGTAESKILSDTSLKDSQVIKKISDFIEFKPKKYEKNNKLGNHEEDVQSSLHMKSIYNTDISPENLESSQNTGKLPAIIRKANHPASLIHFPQPIPIAGEFKRHLKQAVSRRKNEKISS